jgi:protein-S-isoprenylcysteine O-methyltransferase Ste14
MTDHPEPQPSETSADAERRARSVRTNKRQAWIYIAVGVVLTVLGLMGLMAEDRNFLDWLMLGLGLLNLVLGGMQLRRPEPPLG